MTFKAMFLVGLFGFMGYYFLTPEWEGACAGMALGCVVLWLMK